MLRRKGYVSEHVSIFLNRTQRCVYLASDAGRICRCVSFRFFFVDSAWFIFVATAARTSSSRTARHA
jgi:hypothetical protein